MSLSIMPINACKLLSMGCRRGDMVVVYGGEGLYISKHVNI